MRQGFLCVFDLRVPFPFSSIQAAFYLAVYTILAYLAISLHMSMVKQFGSVVAVLVGNSRKSMTIILSFLLFPKPFSSYYVVGGALVMGGLTISAYMKNKSHNSSSSSKGSTTSSSSGGSKRLGGQQSMQIDRGMQGSIRKEQKVQQEQNKVTRCNIYHYHQHHTYLPQPQSELDTHRHTKSICPSPILAIIILILIIIIRKSQHHQQQQEQHTQLMLFLLLSF